MIPLINYYHPEPSTFPFDPNGLVGWTGEHRTPGKEQNDDDPNTKLPGLGKDPLKPGLGKDPVKPGLGNRPPPMPKV